MYTCDIRQLVTTCAEKVVREWAGVCWPAPGVTTSWRPQGYVLGPRVFLAAYVPDKDLCGLRNRLFFSHHQKDHVYLTALMWWTM